ncbi:MAG TPA: hypothetical protein VD861_04890 [Pyrinomonadaceae bacterium]|nr:hypothetical protein [Pyrinomonadaceae bacterium]
MFKRKLLYLSYGGVHYRTANKQSENATELPLAFLFDPVVLSSIECYYPFDTGAMAKWNMGKWTRRLRPTFKSVFRVSGGGHEVPAKLVRYVYGDNETYLRGEVDGKCGGMPPPFPLLCQFLSDNLSSLGIDHRQRMIEGQTSKKLSLSKGLIWVAYPLCKTRDYEPLLWEIYERTAPSIPHFYSYDYPKNFNPMGIAERLQERAADFVQRFLRLR